MKIAIGSDHAGFRYKEEIKRWLTERGHDVHDVGTHSEDPVDYPLYIRPAAETVVRGECERAIVLGGSGNGEAMAANRLQGIRCALCWNEETARLGRQHNDANALSLGQRMIPLETAFEGGRHLRRIQLLDE
jgi:ribose 5-phosphate isomerase B